MPKKKGLEEVTSNAEGMLKTRITALVDYWRRVMGLGEYEIGVHWNGHPRAAAEVKIDDVYLGTSMHFNLGNILTKHSGKDTEDLVVHELVHLLMQPLVTEMDKWIDIAIDNGVEFGNVEKKQYRRVMENVTVRVQRAISNAAEQGSCGKCLGG